MWWMRYWKFEFEILWVGDVMCLGWMNNDLDVNCCVLKWNNL